MMIIILFARVIVVVAAFVLCWLLAVVVGFGLEKINLIGGRGRI